MSEAILPEMKKFKDLHLNLLAEIAARINSVITPEIIFKYLEALQSPAPSTTILYTRTPTIKKLLSEMNLPASTFATQHLKTRSPAVFLDQPQNIWFFAHADEPTYMFPAPIDTDTAMIMAICAHRPKKTGLEFPAAVLRYLEEYQRYEIFSEGVIGTCDDMNPYFKVLRKGKGEFKPGFDRIVYAPTLAFHSDDPQLLSGNIDNAAGIAASLAAIKALTELATQVGMQATDFGAGWVFPDMEEGLPQNPAFFARGARQIINRTAFQDLPKAIINVDGHDAPDLPSTALYGSYVSGGKGPIVPPDVYAQFQQFLKGLGDYGVVAQQTERVGAVSLSDDAGLMEVHDQVMPIGYVVKDPHHNQELPTTNIKSLVHLAQAMAWITVFSTKTYQTEFEKKSLF